MVMALLWTGLAAQTSDPVVVVTASDSIKATTGRHLPRRPVLVSDTVRMADGVRVVNASGDTIIVASIDSIRGIEGVEILADTTASPVMGKVRTFNPDPQRALWMSALCPGLGQIYNRRYWKLPIVVGAFVGLSYGAPWNNRVYLINIVDAYVDASLAHFDISPDLTLDVSPTAIDNGVTGGRLPSLGLQCAFSF